MRGLEQQLLAKKPLTVPEWDEATVYRQAVSDTQLEWTFGLSTETTR